MTLTSKEKRRVFEEEKIKKEMSGKSALTAIILSSFIAGLGDLYCGSFVKAFIFFGLDLFCLLLTFVGIGFFLYIPVWIASIISAWLSASKSEKKKIQKLEKSFG